MNDFFSIIEFSKLFARERKSFVGAVVACTFGLCSDLSLLLVGLPKPLIFPSLSPSSASPFLPARIPRKQRRPPPRRKK